MFDAEFINPGLKGHNDDDDDGDDRADDDHDCHHGHDENTSGPFYENAALKN